MTNLSRIDSGTIGRIQTSDLRPDAAETREPARARRGDDRVEVSDRARLMAKLNAMPDIRTDLVERVRAEIADGTYDTDEKFDLAVDALIDETL